MSEPPSKPPPPAPRVPSGATPPGLCDTTRSDPTAPMQVGRTDPSGPPVFDSPSIASVLEGLTQRADPPALPPRATATTDGDLSASHHQPPAPLPAARPTPPPEPSVIVSPTTLPGNPRPFPLANDTGPARRLSIPARRKQGGKAIYLFALAGGLIAGFFSLERWTGAPPTETRAPRTRSAPAVPPATDTSATAAILPATIKVTDLQSVTTVLEVEKRTPGQTPTHSAAPRGRGKAVSPDNKWLEEERR